MRLLLYVWSGSKSLTASGLLDSSLHICRLVTGEGVGWGSSKTGETKYEKVLSYSRYILYHSCGPQGVQIEQSTLDWQHDRTCDNYVTSYILSDSSPDLVQEEAFTNSYNLKQGHNNLVYTFHSLVPFLTLQID